MTRFTVFSRLWGKCPLRSAIATALALLCVSQSLLAQGTDLARGKTATASSQESATLTPAMAVDGNAATRWSSSFSDPQWLRVDLGSVQSISSVNLVWEAASAKNYTIDVSSNGTTWTTIATKTNMAAGARTDNITGLSASGRYIRMYGTARTTVYGYSLFTFSVYGGVAPKPGTLALVAATYSVNENGGSAGITVNRVNGSDGSVSIGYATVNGTATAGSDYTTKSGTLTFAAGVTSQTITVPITDDAAVESNETFTVTLSNATGGATIGTPSTATITIIDNDQPALVDLALKKPATASSQESTLLTPNMAFDGNATTRWSSAFSDPQWLRVDLGSIASISSVKLVWEAASAKNYTVALSNDGTTWTTIATKTNMAAGARTDSIGGLIASGRYVRMTGTSRTTAYGYSLFTFSVYGTNDRPGLPVRTDYYAMVLNYDPVLGAAYGNKKVSQYYNWWNVDTLINQFTNDLRKATGGQVVWHVAYRNNLNEFPPDLDAGVQHTPDNFPDHYATGVGVSGADYATIAYDSRFGITQKVDAGQIDAVWVFAPPFTGFYETAMAGNNAYWINGIANNITTSKKFVFYGFNYERDIGCMLENFAHMSEQIMTIKGTYWPAKWSYNVWNSFNLRNTGRAQEAKYCNDWQRFVLTDQVNYDAGQSGNYCASPGNAQAGSAHFSPNSTSNYGWFGFSDYFTWGPERWTPYTGTWNMDNGAYHVLAGNGVKSYCRELRNAGYDTADFAMADFVCETDLRVANQSSSSSAGVMFRIAGYNTAANSGTGYYAGINAYSDQVVLARINNGYGLIASPTCVINANVSYHLKIVASGSSIQVFVNNMSTPLINVYDAGYASGGMALASYGTEAWFGNVIVNINAKSYADAWHAYPDLSGPSKNVNFDDWASSQEGWFCWWFEHIPKNPGTHDDVDIVNGQSHTGILNTFWPYILDLNNFDPATGYTNVTFPAKDVQAPAAPTGATATPASSSSMWLSWSEPSDNVGVTRYEIYRNNVLIQQVWHPYYTDNGLAPGTAYTYTIKARDGSANVSAGTTVSGTTMP